MTRYTPAEHHQISLDAGHDGSFYTVADLRRVEAARARTTPTERTPAMTATDDVRWIVINARTRARSEVQAYLYQSTSIVRTYNDGHGDVHIAVTLDPTSTPAASYLADYQAGRLDSGWIPATVWETFAEAVAQVFRVMEEAAR